MTLTLACPKCGTLNSARRTTCEDCTARLGLDARRLTKEIVNQRTRRTFGECVYCSRPTTGRACTAHRPLLKLDPHYATEGMTV